MKEDFDVLLDEEIRLFLQYHSQENNFSEPWKHCPIHEHIL